MEEVVQETIIKPVATGVTLTAAGKAKAKQKKKMIIEEDDAPSKAQDPEPVQEERVPINEPPFVKEEAYLLYEGMLF